MTTDRLGMSTFSQLMKVTMPPVARMEDRLKPLVHIVRLILGRHKPGNHTPELQTPQLMYKTQH
ncbi:hypothetical protein HO173_004808 [Letharia columbiana]|uniref:Uncharacterized protein n=1 Tax=Letharia columbiana TaxID=112416 RepID=A0A8H6FXZ2_9LECA|nr:uncharacterized protein HO173_004808 [Letharia columbiana]KAF6236931.1 hypothetical protein HO173_004808 [Letharia columbiana]